MKNFCHRVIFTLQFNKINKFNVFKVIYLCEEKIYINVPIAVDFVGGY